MDAFGFGALCEETNSTCLHVMMLKPVRMCLVSPPAWRTLDSHTVHRSEYIVCSCPSLCAGAEELNQLEHVGVSTCMYCVSGDHEVCLACDPAPPSSISPSPSPQSPSRWCVRSPPAGPAGRTAPTRSGRSWTFSDWTAAASQSEHELTPPHCRTKDRREDKVVRTTDDSTSADPKPVGSERTSRRNRTAGQNS